MYIATLVAMVFSECRTIKASELAPFTAQHNSTLAGTLTPAGQALVQAGLFTRAPLRRGGHNIWWGKQHRTSDVIKCGFAERLRETEQMRAKVLRFVFSACLSLLLAVPGVCDKLSERHKKWLEQEVVYIISKEERDLFLRLASDDDRDKYIDQFWARRDPTPGTPENEYKDEHYKRLAYANTYFGSEWNTDGWRTDRGKIYIILGPPATRQQYPSGGQIYPIELWFYNNPNEPSLPPFFNVMFYQKDGISDYRLYSPYLDGPTKLVRASGTENRPDRAYRFLRDFNVEVARASLSLIPSEPIDVNAGPSLSSDSMLRKIINIADDKFHKERIGLTARLQQDVSIRLIPDESNLRAIAVPIMDINGESYLHYALQTGDPSTFALGRYKDQLYIGLEAHVRVTDADSKAVVKEVTREATAYFTDKQAEEIISTPISFEDRIALPPGKYQVEFGLLNRLNRIYSRASLPVQVDPPAAALTVSKPVVVAKCLSASNLLAPFVFGNFRCSLAARNDVQPGPDAAINLLFSVNSPSGKKPASALRVEYTVGRLDRVIAPRTIEDRLDPGRFDAAGRLFVGKSIPLSNLPEGNYVLSIKVFEGEGAKNTATSMSFRITRNGIGHNAAFKVLEPGDTPPPGS